MMLPVTLKHSSPDTQVISRLVLRFGIISVYIIVIQLFNFLKGIQAFLRETVKNCSKNGYVKTLLGRKRFLPGIKESNMYIKSHVRFFIRPLQNNGRQKKSELFFLNLFFSHFRQSDRQWIQQFRALQQISSNWLLSISSADWRWLFLKCCCHISITPEGQVNPPVSKVKMILLSLG